MQMFNSLPGKNAFIDSNIEAFSKPFRAEQLLRTFE
jgi:hypothetical protein